MSEKLTPVELGVKFNPPTLILHYSKSGIRGGSGKPLFRKRSMPIRGLTKASNCYDQAESIKKRHVKFLGEIPTVRIEKFIRFSSR